MSCLGVHFALTDKQAERLLSAGSDAEVESIVKEEIERGWDEEWLAETGHAWDAIHRCLTDKTLQIKDSSPLSKCILGGQQLHRGKEYIVAFLDPVETKKVFDAIRDIDHNWFQRKYFALDEIQTGYPLDEDDCEVAWSYFEELQHFFQNAAQDRRAVIFTVDQ